MSTVIKVENLSKRYYLSHKDQERFPTLRDAIATTASNMGKRLLHPLRASSGQPLEGLDSTEEFWALNDVSFEVNQGDRVGIIGRNGAGKSTLLKILSRITEPTKGRVSIKGRTASLLEVGTGFHPELTGRENIFLNGAILGMSRVDIKHKFDEIVAFSEVERFLDTPVKRYSSGMYVRLAFAVAAHLEPEVLIVDEVLAVGDAQFQKKCLGKMEAIGAEGRTVLFVSHNMTALKSLCSSALWLNQGEVVESGETQEVVSNYLQFGAQAVVEQYWDDINTAPGNELVRFRRVGLVPQDRERGINVTMPLKMEFELWNYVPDATLNFSMHLYNQEGLCILNDGSGAFTAPTGWVKGVCQIPGNFLNNDVYRVMIMVVKDASVAIYSLHDALVFEVHDIERQGTAWFGKWPGVVRPHFDWEVQCQE